MSARAMLVVGAALAGLAVAAGAFGAHGLKSLVTADRLATFETAVRYQFYHAMALMVVGLLAERVGALGAVGALFVAGIVVFSGSLYLLVLTDTRWLGAVTPLGGVAFIAGWALLVWRLARA